METLFEMRTEDDIRREAIAANETAILNALCGKGPWNLSDRERRLLEILRAKQGRNRAITIGELGERLKTTPREIKGDVRSMVVSFGLAIVASRDGETGGYYFATTAEERVLGSQPYIQEALALLERARIIRNVADMRTLLGQLAMNLTEGEKL